MGIVIVNIVGFVIIVAVIVRYIAPPVRSAMSKQQDAVATQITEAEAARKRLASARDAHANAVEEARASASQIREEARGDAQAIAEEMAAQADSEVARITEHGRSQVALNRSNLVRALRSDLGLASVELAGDAIRDHLADDDARRESIDRVIDELEAMAGDDTSGGHRVPSTTDLVGLHSMRAASREAVRSVTGAFDSRTESLDDGALRALADELTGVVELLGREPVLRKHLAEPSDDADSKTGLVDTLLSGKVSDDTLGLLRTAVTGRWSATGDLAVALERLARYALLIVAEKSDTIDDVEDQLFRLGRLLVAQPKLSSLLSDRTAPVDGRLELIDSLLADKVDPTTKALVDQTVRLLRGQSAASAVSDLAELAAARRGESVAHVVAAIEPTDAQRGRIADVLGRIYDRDISTQVEVDPGLLGGLRVSIGDEVIDADIATRLARAAEDLPS